MFLAGTPEPGEPELRTDQEPLNEQKEEEEEVEQVTPKGLTTSNIQDLLAQLSKDELVSGNEFSSGGKKTTTENIQASTYKPNIDVEQLIGLRNYVDLFRTKEVYMDDDKVEDDVKVEDDEKIEDDEKVEDDKKVEEMNKVKMRLQETELQRLLNELSRNEFQVPNQAWDIRKAAQLLKQKQRFNQVRELKVF